MRWKEVNVQAFNRDELHFWWGCSVRVFQVSVFLLSVSLFLLEFSVGGPSIRCPSVSCPSARCPSVKCLSVRGPSAKPSWWGCLWVAANSRRCVHSGAKYSGLPRQEVQIDTARINSIKTRC